MKYVYQPAIASLLFGLGVSIGGAQAAVLFADTFDRADTPNPTIDSSLDGITDNTGSSLTANNVYGQPHTVGGSFIDSNQLELADGSGTANAYIDHNFINAGILAGVGVGFRVSVDVTGIQQGASNSQGGAFAIGMTLAEASSAGDAIGAGALTSAFGGNSFASDFWVGLRHDSTVAWGGNGLTEQSTGVGANTGTISADFLFESFNAGSTVNYEVFFGGTSLDTGTFTWSDTGANYIGLDARDGQGVTFDNLQVNILSVPEPSTLALLVLAMPLLRTLRRRR